MARPRKPGLRIHKGRSNGRHDPNKDRYYINDPRTGKEVYFGYVRDGHERADQSYLLWRVIHDPRFHHLDIEVVPKGKVIPPPRRVRIGEPTILTHKMLDQFAASGGTRPSRLPRRSAARKTKVPTGTVRPHHPPAVPRWLKDKLHLDPGEGAEHESTAAPRSPGRLPDSEKSTQPVSVQEPSSRIKTVADMGRLYLAEKKGLIAPNTWSQAKAAWEEFCKIVGKKLLVAKIDKATIRKYRKRIKDEQKRGHFTDSYHSNRFRKIKAVVNYGLTEYDADGMSEDRVAGLLRNLGMLRCTESMPSPRPITPDEFCALLWVSDEWAATPIPVGEPVSLNGLSMKSAERKIALQRNSQLARSIQLARERRWLGVQFRAIYLTALNLAFYPVDVSRLPWTALDLESGAVNFDREKKSTPRVGVLWARTITAFSAWQAVSRSRTLVFANKRGSAWTRNGIARILNDQKKYLRERGRPIADDVTFSTIRDGCETACLDAEIDDKAIDILAGHRLPGVKDRYAKRYHRVVREAVSAIEKHYFAAE